MKHVYLSLLMLTCSMARLSAQQTFPIFTQNYANPFALNPSMITLDGRSEINVMYRQQWSGISNAPKTIQADLQYLLSKKISIGLNAYNDKTILLNSSGALATFGYRVLLSSRHVLGFGLSGGFISNHVDLSDVAAPDLPDMALYKSNEFMPDAQAGVHYRNRNLVIGGSLLKLVDNLPYKNLSEEASSRKFDPFKDRSGFMSYKINLSPASSLQPVVYYRNTFTGYEYFEGTLLFNYKAITIGGGYRTDFGPTALLRVRIKDLHAGFSYDLPANRYGGSTGGTYEAQLKFQLGRTVNPLAQKEDSDSVQSLADKPIEPEVENNQEVAAAEIEKAAQKNQPAATPQTTTPAKSDAVVTNPPQPTSLQPATPPAKDPGVEETHAPHVEQTIGKSTNEAANAGHYLVVGAYKNFDNALKQIENLKAKGYEPGVIYLSEKQYHYVYLFHSGNKQETVDRLRRIRQQNQFFGAWLLNVE